MFFSFFMVKNSVSFGQIRGFFFILVFDVLSLNLNRTIRAHPKTQAAGRTTVRVVDFRIGKPLIVEISGQAKYLLRAKQDTHPATLTAMLIKVNFIHLVPYNRTLLAFSSYGQGGFGSTQFVKRYIPVLPDRLVAMSADNACDFFGTSTVGDLKLFGSALFTGIAAGIGF